MHVFALEIGLSDLRSAFVRENGQVEELARVRTDWGEVGAATVRQVLAAVKEGLGRMPGAVGVGVAVTGPVSAEGTIVGVRAGQENWRGTRLRQMIEQGTGLAAVVANDGVLMALGEHRYGAGEGARCLVGLVIDDAVSAGVVVEGRILEGAHGQAGGLSHLPVDGDGRPCHCGARGCLEAHLGGAALVARYREMTGREVTAVGVVDRADDGEVSAATLMRDVERELKILVQAVMAVADPDRLVLGGALGVRLGPRVSAIAETLGARRHPAGPLAVVRGRLGPQAALSGAASAAWARVAARAQVPTQ